MGAASAPSGPGVETYECVTKLDDSASASTSVRVLLESSDVVTPAPAPGSEAPAPAPEESSGTSGNLTPPQNVRDLLASLLKRFKNNPVSSERNISIYLFIYFLFFYLFFYLHIYLYM